MTRSRAPEPAAASTGAGDDRRRWLSAWAPVLAWALLLFLVSSISGDALLAPAFSHSDKIIHATAYAVLGLLLTRGAALHRQRLDARSVALAVMVALAYGVSDELHQMFVPMRSPDLLDLAADALGATLGALTYLAVRRKRHHI